jgi:transcriptional regulator with XRE-family HTH domain
MTKQALKEAVLKKEIGLRFKQFREAIKKSQQKLADELKVYNGTIINIEKGRFFPKFKFMYYLYRQYHLNLNWLLNGKGEMMISPQEDSMNAYISQLLSPMDENDPRYEKFVELFSLMRIPAVEKIILGKLAEIKALAKEEIKTFFEGT